MAPIAAQAERVRADRHQAAPDNPLIAMEHAVSDAIVQTFEFWTNVRDNVQEAVFLSTYGSPWLQAWAGLGAQTPMSGRRIERDLAREAVTSRSAEERMQRIDKGGLLEAGVRALIYVRMAEGKLDERAYAALQQIATANPKREIGLMGFKEILRDQYLMLLRDEERTISALPKLLPSDRHRRADMLDKVRRIITAGDALSPEGQHRLARIEAMFDAGDAPRAAGKGKPASAHAGDDDDG